MGRAGHLAPAGMVGPGCWEAAGQLWALQMGTPWGGFSWCCLPVSAFLSLCPSFSLFVCPALSLFLCPSFLLPLLLLSLCPSCPCLSLLILLFFFPSFFAVHLSCCLLPFFFLHPTALLLIHLTCPSPIFCSPSVLFSPALCPAPRLTPFLFVPLPVPFFFLHLSFPFCHSFCFPTCFSLHSCVPLPVSLSLYPTVLLAIPLCLSLSSSQSLFFSLPICPPAPRPYFFMYVFVLLPVPVFFSVPLPLPLFLAIPLCPASCPFFSSLSILLPSPIIYSAVAALQPIPAGADHSSSA